MLKKIGRLNNDDIKELNSLLKGIFAQMEEKPAKAEKDLLEIAKSPNYFVREELGKALTGYKDQGQMTELCQRMLEHKLYGIRATGLFYFYNRHRTEPEKILAVVQKTIESIPWESEALINELWTRYPDVMKAEMLKWVKSPDEKVRAIAFHGMENIAGSDPSYIMGFIAEALDDEAVEVQKKITHILTQVARSKPAECYPYIREWITQAGETRLKTLWVSMKKLANIVVQKSRKDKSQEFMMLTQQTINDWKNDNNEQVATMGRKLVAVMHKPPTADDDY